MQNPDLSAKMTAELIYLCNGGTPSSVKRNTLDALRARGLVNGRGRPTPEGHTYAREHGGERP